MTETSLVFYTHPQSRGRVVRWMLEEVDVPYETVSLKYGTSMKTPEYLLTNSMGKVPAIQHGKVVVTEVAAICAYLADIFPTAGLAPTLHRRGRAPTTAGCSLPQGPSKPRPATGPSVLLCRLGVNV